jgi:hypothetical protein
VVHPVAVRRARRARLRLVVRAVAADQAATEVLPRARRGTQPALMLTVDRKERFARLSLVGPAADMPDLLPVPAHGAGSFDEAGMRVVWADVPLEQVSAAARAVHAGLMAGRRPA